MYCLGVFASVPDFFSKRMWTGENRPVTRLFFKPKKALRVLLQYQDRDICYGGPQQWVWRVFFCFWRRLVSIAGFASGEDFWWCFGETFWVDWVFRKGLICRVASLFVNLLLSKVQYCPRYFLVPLLSKPIKVRVTDTINTGIVIVMFFSFSRSELRGTD